MNPLMYIIGAGVMINSALYLIFVFIAAIALHRNPALWAVITATGVSYLSYYAQALVLAGKLGYSVTVALVLLSITFALAAGLLLLV